MKQLASMLGDPSALGPVLDRLFQDRPLALGLALVGLVALGMICWVVQKVLLHRHVEARRGETVIRIGEKPPGGAPFEIYSVEDVEGEVSNANGDRAKASERPIAPTIYELRRRPMGDPEEIPKESTGC